MSSYVQVSSPANVDGNCALVPDYLCRAFPDKGKTKHLLWKPVLHTGGRGGREGVFNDEFAKTKNKSDLLLGPSYSTKDWNFCREEANER